MWSIAEEYMKQHFESKICLTVWADNPKTVAWLLVERCGDCKKRSPGILTNKQKKVTLSQQAHIVARTKTSREQRDQERSPTHTTTRTIGLHWVFLSQLFSQRSMVKHSVLKILKVKKAKAVKLR